MNKPKVIALYLPQYHPTPDNDRWWGKGFTEWTNVGKAKPLYPGHYQPKVPADLGYYDLRLPEVREAQAQLAKEAGIYGFCYYHYWFGNGKQELETPFKEVVNSGKPDFPFMLCWANESWHKMFWNKDGKGSSKEVLIEQTYPGEEDIINHFNYLLPAFKDKRYIKIDGKPAFMIYRPFQYEGVETFMALWQKLAKANGLNGIYFIAQKQSYSQIHTSEIDLLETYKSQGFSALNVVRLYDAYGSVSKTSRYWNIFKKIILNSPWVYSYESMIKKLSAPNDSHPEIFPTLIPNWDHTPRSGKAGLVFANSTPELFDIHVKDIMDKVKNKDRNHNFIFLKSWNEWGEGNYVEPDLKYGKGYLDVLKRNLIQEE